MHIPNGQAVASTFGKPITGPICLLGSGSGREIKGRNLNGAIAVLNGDSGEAWLTCAGRRGGHYLHQPRTH